MRKLAHLFARNREWSRRQREQDPGFFARLAGQQAPRYLWIGCSDSRVPANQIVDLPPGELFVHRNVANLVVHSDLNLLSVLQFAVDVLGVEHVIVCGHYGCGGVQAALEGSRHGLVDNWLRLVQEIAARHADILAGAAEGERAARLCELNVIEQVANVCQTTIVQDAWQRGQHLSIHGWVYAVGDGLLRDLDVCVAAEAEAADAVAGAVARCRAEGPAPVAAQD